MKATYECKTQSGETGRIKCSVDTSCLDIMVSVFAEHREKDFEEALETF